MAYLQKDSNSGVFYIILACFFWGTSGTVFTFFSPEDAQPAVIGILRLIVTVLILAVVVFLQKHPLKLRAWPLPILLATGFLIASMQFCFFTAVDLAGVALGTTFFYRQLPYLCRDFRFSDPQGASRKQMVGVDGFSDYRGCLDDLGERCC